MAVLIALAVTGRTIRARRTEEVKDVELTDSLAEPIEDALAELKDNEDALAAPEQEQSELNLVEQVPIAVTEVIEDQPTLVIEDAIIDMAVVREPVTNEEVAENSNIATEEEVPEALAETTTTLSEAEDEPSLSESQDIKVMAAEEKVPEPLTPATTSTLSKAIDDEVLTDVEDAPSSESQEDTIPTTNSESPCAAPSSSSDQPTLVIEDAIVDMPVVREPAPNEEVAENRNIATEEEVPEPLAATTTTFSWADDEPSLSESEEDTIPTTNINSPCAAPSSSSESESDWQVVPRNRQKQKQKKTPAHQTSFPTAPCPSTQESKAKTKAERDALAMASW
ncbi:hypothetical protein C0991_007753, partial [Blastosporella zonata]